MRLIDMPTKSCSNNVLLIQGCKDGDTTVDEIFLFLGILINVGIIPLPSNSFYWSQKSTKNVVFFPKCMARDRLQLLYHTMLGCLK